jgi:hypothetical protein
MRRSTLADSVTLYEPLRKSSAAAPAAELLAAQADLLKVSYGPN